MSIMRLSNGIVIDRKRSDEFFDNKGRQIVPPSETNSYTYAFGTWIIERKENISINPGYAGKDGKCSKGKDRKKKFIKSIMEDCKALDIECKFIPISKDLKKTRSRVKKAMKGTNKVLIKAFWSPRGKNNLYHYRFIRKAKDGKWLEGLGGFGGVFCWEEEQDELKGRRPIKPIGYFVIKE